MTKVKCVAVGDQGIGRFSLLDNFTKETQGGSGERYSTYFEIEGEEIHLVICYSAVEDHYSEIRSLDYPEAKAVLLCFSIVDPVSFHNIKAKWYPEIKKHCPDLPFVIVGTRVDLRGNEEAVTREQGEAVAKELGAYGYFECSGLKPEGATDAFETLARSALGLPSSFNR